MNEEMKVLERNKTWELTNLSNGAQIVGLKQIYKTKYRSDGSVQKYKDRLVAHGYMQHKGMDFDETFAPVARFDIIMHACGSSDPK